jgi:hypothetical protein
VPALTAHRCVFADGPVSGATVLVIGGAGMVAHVGSPSAPCSLGEAAAHQHVENGHAPGKVLILP